MAHRQSLLAALLLFPLANGAFSQPPAAPTPSPAAQPPQTAPDASTPTLKVKTRLTVEDVTVTDGKDKPVHGLTQPDFTVKEDGKVQAIKNFEEYDATVEQTPSQLPPGTYSNRQAATPTAFNILLLDNVSTGPEKTLAIERQQAIKYLKTLPEGNQVAIMKMEFVGGVSVVQGFTSNRDVLLAAIDTIQPEAPLLLGCETPNRMSEITTSFSGWDCGLCLGNQWKEKPHLVYPPGDPVANELPTF